MFEELQLGAESQHRMMVAMRLNERLPAAPGLGKTVGAGSDEIGDVHDLLRKALRIGAMRDEIGKLVLERGGAGRLQSDHRSSGRNVLREAFQNILELPPRPIEKAPIVERPAAAERARRDGDDEAGRFEEPGSR